MMQLSDFVHDRWQVVVEVFILASSQKKTFSKSTLSLKRALWGWFYQETYLFHWLASLNLVSMAVKSDIVQSRDMLQN